MYLMNTDLDYCLKCFVDEELNGSIKHIDQVRRNIQKQRNKNLEAESLQQDDTTTNQKENVIVEKFLHDLNDNNMAINRTRQTIINEFRKVLDNIKLDIDGIAYITTTKKNIQQDNEEMRIASNKIRHQIASIDSAIACLFNMIDFHNSTTSYSRIKQWFHQHYGYANEFNRMAGKSNSSDDQSIFSDKGPLMQCILERVPLWHRREKLIISFINQMDEESSTKNHLLQSLYRVTDVPSTTKFIRSYIDDRQRENRHRREQLLHKMELELEQQQIEHKTRATELVNALYQLSPSSICDFDLNKKLKKIFYQVEAARQFVPILIDHSEETEGKRRNRHLYDLFIFHSWESFVDNTTRG